MREHSMCNRKKKQIDPDWIGFNSIPIPFPIHVRSRSRIHFVFFAISGSDDEIEIFESRPS